MTTFKNIGGFILIAVTFIITTLLGRLFIWDKARRRRFSSKCVSVFSRLSLLWLNVKVKVTNPGLLPLENQGYLAISNHLSYLDILVLGSLRNFVFVTSNDLREDAFQGGMSDLGGSVFVERRNPFGLKRDIVKVQKLLEKGFSVFLFPEGTSSNGQGVLNFKPALFSAAMKAKVPVAPMCLHYLEANGKPFAQEAGEKVFYYGEQTFGAQLIKLFSIKSLTIGVTALPPLDPSSFETRKTLAHEARRRIVDAYLAPEPSVPVPPPDAALI